MRLAANADKHLSPQPPASPIPDIIQPFCVSECARHDGKPTICFDAIQKLRKRSIDVTNSSAMWSRQEFQERILQRGRQRPEQIKSKFSAEAHTRSWAPTSKFCLTPRPYLERGIIRNGLGELYSNRQWPSWGRDVIIFHVFCGDPRGLLGGVRFFSRLLLIDDGCSARIHSPCPPHRTVRLRNHCLKFTPLSLFPAPHNERS